MLRAYVLRFNVPVSADAPNGWMQYGKEVFSADPKVCALPDGVERPATDAEALRMAQKRAQGINRNCGTDNKSRIPKGSPVYVKRIDR